MHVPGQIILPSSLGDGGALQLATLTLLLLTQSPEKGPAQSEKGTGLLMVNSKLFEVAWPS